jgi:4-diphosphocytidyl-2C-methyl-D-erythritol kinase
MGYVNTPAHMTASNAFHAGDSVWPGNQALVVRRANVYPTNPVNHPTAPGGSYLGEVGDLGWEEMIGPLISALTSAGTTVYSVVESKKQAKDAKRQQQDADAAAAAAQAQAAAVAAQAQTQIRTTQQKQEDEKAKYMPWMIGAGALVGVGLLVFMLKR